MEKRLFEKVYNYPALRSEELKDIINAHTKVDFFKKDCFLEIGKTANEYYLIEKGLFGSFVTDYNGNEITTGFYSPGEILIEVSSLFQRLPSEENLIALTNGSAWKIEYETFEQLFQKMEGLREWGRAWMAEQLFVSKQRSIDMLTKSATDRYLALMNERPQIIKHASLKHIASWLGITDTSLSRVRKNILSK